MNNYIFPDMTMDYMELGMALHDIFHTYSDTCPVIHNPLVLESHTLANHRGDVRTEYQKNPILSANLSNLSEIRSSLLIRSNDYS